MVRKVHPGRRHRPDRPLYRGPVPAACRLRPALRRAEAHCHHRTALPAAPGLRFRSHRIGRGIRRHGPDVQPARRARATGNDGPDSAAVLHDAHSRRHRRRPEDEQEPGQLCRRGRAARGHVRQDHVHRRHPDRPVLRAADRPAVGCTLRPGARPGTGLGQPNGSQEAAGVGHHSPVPRLGCG